MSKPLASLKLAANSAEKPTAPDYLTHARATNSVAKRALRLDTENVPVMEAKISIGLSLQAAELAGKAILRALGYSPLSIRKRHREHDVLLLLKEAQQQVALRSSAVHEFAGHRRFLPRAVVIDGQPFGGTILEYLEKHFGQGDQALPRSYFYPDFEKFTGPDPIQGLCYMIDDVIGEAEAIATIALANP